MFSCTTLAAQGAREEVFEFAQEPRVKKAGGGYVITFAPKGGHPSPRLRRPPSEASAKEGGCDAAVEIVGPEGKVVRHLC